MIHQTIKNNNLQEYLNNMRFKVYYQKIKKLFSQNLKIIL